MDELEDAAGAEARGRIRVGVCGGPVDDDGGGRKRVAVDVVWGRTRVLVGRKSVNTRLITMANKCLP